MLKYKVGNSADKNPPRRKSFPGGVILTTEYKKNIADSTDNLKYYDLHTHSRYSFDGDKTPAGEIDAMAKAAISAGLRGIAVTDHCDIDGVLDGYYPKYDKEEIRRDVFAAKEKYAGKLGILYGIELGQPHAKPEEARRLLDECRFEYVLGSLHNLRGVPDFSFFHYGKMEPEVIDHFIGRAVDELCEIARFPGITTMAHITYPARYMRQDGVKYDFLKFEKKWRELFHIMIENGLNLEINTSGLRKPNDGKTMPESDLIALYKDQGGKRFTLGSDAHTSGDIGKGLAEGLEKIK